MYAIYYQEQDIKVIEIPPQDAEVVCFLWDKNYFDFDSAYITDHFIANEGAVTTYECLNDWYEDDVCLDVSRNEYHKLIEQWTDKAKELGYLSQPED